MPSNNRAGVVTGESGNSSSLRRCRSSQGGASHSRLVERNGAGDSAAAGGQVSGLVVHVSRTT